jgi:hypothetical protein
VIARTRLNVAYVNGCLFLSALMSSSPGLGLLPLVASMAACMVGG